MITPTIGRRVWYFPSEFDRVEHHDPVHQPDHSQPLDAGIAYVHSQTMVNLTVADQNGTMHARTSVRLLQTDECAAEGEAYAQWMPYQAVRESLKVETTAPEEVSKALDEASKRPALTEADAAADLAGTPRPDNPSAEATAFQQAQGKAIGSEAPKGVVASIGDMLTGGKKAKKAKK